jgi:S-formylglutathione hydrolase FrmB
VVHKIDNTYRTINDRKGRFITGLSMGGHGAMYLSANIQNSLALQVWWVADMEV